MHTYEHAFIHTYKSSFCHSIILLCKSEVKLVTETEHHSGQRQKVLTPGQLRCSMCGTKKRSSVGEKLLTLDACVASPSVAASLSAEEAGQCQAAMFYELVSTKLTTFPQASHWRTWLWPRSCCSQTTGSVHCASQHIHIHTYALPYMCTFKGLGRAVDSSDFPQETAPLVFN